MGLATLADDSGLEVDVLGGAPGIYSARYDGPCGNGRIALHAVARQPGERPLGEAWGRASAVLSRSLYRGAQGVQPIGEGRCEGFIARMPAGQHGFGYDPVFFIPQLGASMAQLPPEIKNRISHRARAVQAARIPLAGQLFPDLILREPGDVESSRTTEVRIRPIEFADHASLQQHCYPHEAPGAVRERVRWAAIRSHEGALVAMVGELDGDVIAHAQLHLKGRIGEISSLIVSEPMREQGIATAMVQGAERDRARSRRPDLDGCCRSASETRSGFLPGFGVRTLQDGQSSTSGLCVLRALHEANVRLSSHSPGSDSPDGTASRHRVAWSSKLNGVVPEAMPRNAPAGAIRLLVAVEIIANRLIERRRPHVVAQIIVQNAALGVDDGFVIVGRKC